MAGRKNTDAGIDALCEDAIWWATEGNLGYDQGQRDSWRQSGWKTGTEVDCSSFVIALLNRHGYRTGGATYTGNMRSNLKAHGWAVVAVDGKPRKGDVLLNDTHHTALCVGGGMLVQASRGEAGHRVHGGRAGDQDGYETNWSKYYSYPWTCYLRYVRSQPTKTGDTEAQERWWLGSVTCKRWQRAAGTEVDGTVSGQSRDGDKFRPNVTCCEYGGGGSELVRHVQAVAAADVDGLWGADTSKGIQRYLKAHGYDCGPIDGYFGSESVKALCQSLDKAPQIWR